MLDNPAFSQASITKKIDTAWLFGKFQSALRDAVIERSMQYPVNK